MINLRDLAVDTKQIEIEFPGLDGFVLSINHISKHKSRELLKLAQKTVIKPGGAREVEVDNSKFNTLFAENAITGWKGLTMAHLEKLMLADLSGKDPKEEIPFSVDNAATLLDNSALFDEWINGLVFQIDGFQSGK
jgi:hypothetical protein